MIRFAIVLLLLWSISLNSWCQSISHHVPEKINKQGNYLFYLHGRIVQEQGIHAVSPEYGPYEYLAIVDTLQHYDFHVISERRPKGTEMNSYAEKVSQQIDTLLRAGVPPNHISVLGSSMGAGITMQVSILTNHKNINYIIMGLCSEDMFQYVRENKLVFCGTFLSVYETSDAYNSCDPIFIHQPGITDYQEIALTMNNKHGFIYKPYAEWVHPVIAWVKSKK